jgi:hypothetical protein
MVTRWRGVMLSITMLSNGTRVWGQSVPQQVPLGYQYIFGGLNGNCNVVPHNQWGGIAGN